jgi:hypothetical protein
MGMACNMNGGEEECMWDIGGEDKGVGGWTILKWII